MASNQTDGKDERLYSCGICFEVYDQGKHCPKYLACHHTFCLSCVEGTVSREMEITCPTCQGLTFLDAGISAFHLRTNNHALQLATYKQEAKKSVMFGDLWCETCDNFAELNRCLRGHSFTPLEMRNSGQSNVEDIRKARLTLFHAMNKLRRTETFYSNIVELLETLKENVLELQRGNSSERESIAGKIEWLKNLEQRNGIQESNPAASNADPSTTQVVNHVDPIDTIQLKQVSVDPEPSQGDPATLPPNKKIKLEPGTQLEDSLIICDGTVDAITPVLSNKQKTNQPGGPQQEQALLETSQSPTTVSQSLVQQPIATEVIRNPVFSIPRSTPQSKICYMRMNYNGTPSARFKDSGPELIFETFPKYSQRLCKIFERGFGSTPEINFLDHSVTKAVLNQYVQFGRDPPKKLHDSLRHLPMLQKRGDVGLWFQGSIEDAERCPTPCGFIIWLSKSQPPQMRKIPVVATLVKGYRLCEYLSSLNSQSRKSVFVDLVKVS